MSSKTIRVKLQRPQPLSPEWDGYVDKLLYYAAMANIDTPEYNKRLFPADVESDLGVLGEVITKLQNFRRTSKDANNPSCKEKEFILRNRYDTKAFYQYLYQIKSWAQSDQQAVASLLVGCPSLQAQVSIMKSALDSLKKNVRGTLSTESQSQGHAQNQSKSFAQVTDLKKIADSIQSKTREIEKKILGLLSLAASRSQTDNSRIPAAQNERDKNIKQLAAFSGPPKSPAIPFPSVPQTISLALPQQEKTTGTAKENAIRSKTVTQNTTQEQNQKPSQTLTPGATLPLSKTASQMKNTGNPTAGNRGAASSKQTEFKSGKPSNPLIPTPEQFRPSPIVWSPVPELSLPVQPLLRALPVLLPVLAPLPPIPNFQNASEIQSSTWSWPNPGPELANTLAMLENNIRQVQSLNDFAANFELFFEAYHVALGLSRRQEVLQHPELLDKFNTLAEILKIWEQQYSARFSEQRQLALRQQQILDHLLDLSKQIEFLLGKILGQLQELGIFARPLNPEYWAEKCIKNFGNETPEELAEMRSVAAAIGINSEGMTKSLLCQLLGYHVPGIPSEFLKGHWPWTRTDNSVQLLNYWKDITDQVRPLGINPNLLLLWYYTIDGQEEKAITYLREEPVEGQIMRIPVTFNRRTEVTGPPETSFERISGQFPLNDQIVYDKMSPPDLQKRYPFYRIEVAKHGVGDRVLFYPQAHKVIINSVKIALAEIVGSMITILKEGPDVVELDLGELKQSHPEYDALAPSEKMLAWVTKYPPWTLSAEDKANINESKRTITFTKITE